jgi:hypothetical protein
MMSNLSDISFVQIPQFFGQFHVNPALVRIDCLDVFIRERNQYFLAGAIDAQYVGPAGFDNVGYRSDKLAIRAVNRATLQLKGIKPACLCGGQIFGSDLNFSANVLFGLRNRIDAFEFCDAPPVLPATLFDFSVALDAPPCNQDSAAGLEDGVLFEQLFDSDFAFQPLSLRDPRD